MSDNCTAQRDEAAPLGVTLMLKRYQRGDQSVLGSLFAEVYGELHRIARFQHRRLDQAGTISPTALVNEAYLKLVDARQVSIEDRAHFFALAARAMRQILINYLELRSAEKRGGNQTHVDIDEASVAAECNAELIHDVNRALENLREIDADLAAIVEMRFFAGMTDQQIASILKCTDRTVRRQWCKAKALLLATLQA